MSTPEVQAPYLVALMGFGGFEQQALDAYLKLARSRTPSYGLCATIEEADFVVANGERSGVIDLLGAAQRMGDTVLVGPEQAGAGACMARPIDPLALFRTLDEAVKRRSLAATAARVGSRNVTMAEVATSWAGGGGDTHRRAAFYAPPPSQPTPQARAPRTAAAEVARPAIPASDTSGRTGDATGRSSDITGRAGGFARRTRETSGGDDDASVRSDSHGASVACAPRRLRTPGLGVLNALVVDRSSDTAALVAMFEAQNVKAACVGKAHHAFAMLDAFAFDLVLINVDLGPLSELDGMQVSHALKRQQRAPGEFCPPIVLMSARPSALERARMLLVGGSVYLTKPVQAPLLAGALVEVGLRPAPPAEAALAAERVG